MSAKGQLKGEYVKCEWCGKLVYKTPSQLKKHKHHYQDMDGSKIKEYIKIAV